jgi:hypothetical protein
MSKAASVPGFLTKTYEIFNTPEYHEICSWGPNGDTINIKKVSLRPPETWLRRLLVAYAVAVFVP